MGTKPATGSWVLVLGIAVLLIAMALALLGLHLGWWGADHTAWWAAVSSNLVATTFGIVGGVPIGVSIVRWQERRAANADEEKRQGEIRATRAALQSELEWNDVLAAGWKRMLSKSNYAAYDRFSVALWDVLRESGALAGFEVDLLRALAALYERYAVFNRLHELLLQAEHYPGMVGNSSVPKQIAESMAKCLETVDERQAAACKALGVARPRITFEN